MSGRNSTRVRIVGLTGGVASGKNFIAEIFAQNGAKVFDADKEVHDLIANNSLVIAKIRENFPESLVDGVVNRKALGQIVFDSKAPQKLLILEKIIHPEVQKKYQDFLAKVKKSSNKIAVLNIPLLQEKKSYECDLIIAAIAPKAVRRKRFLARERKKDRENFVKNLDQLKKKFEQICQSQLTNFQQKNNADYVLNTSQSKAKTKLDAEKLYAEIFGANCCCAPQKSITRN